MLQAQLFIDSEEMQGEQSLHDYVMKLLAEKDIGGATSFKGYAGYGHHGKIKFPGELFSFDEPPVMILFIDEDDKIRQAVKDLRSLLPTKLIIVTATENI